MSELSKIKELEEAYKKLNEQKAKSIALTEAESDGSINVQERTRQLAGDVERVNRRAASSSREYTRNQREATKETKSLFGEIVDLSNAAKALDPELFDALTDSALTFGGKIGDVSEATTDLSSFMTKMYLETSENFYKAIEGTDKSLSYSIENKDEFVKYMRDILEEDTTVTRTIMENQDTMNAEAFAASRQLAIAMGGTAEETRNIIEILARESINGMEEMNISKFKNMALFAKQVTDTTDLNFKAISRHMLDMSQDVYKFGTLTDEQMSKAAAAMEKLGVSASESAAIMAGFGDVQSSADKIGKLVATLGAVGISADFDQQALMMAATERNAGEFFRLIQEGLGEADYEKIKNNPAVKRVIADSLGANIELLPALFSDSVDEVLAKIEDKDAPKIDVDATSISETLNALDDQITGTSGARQAAVNAEAAAAHALASETMSSVAKLEKATTDGIVRSTSTATEKMGDLKESLKVAHEEYSAGKMTTEEYLKVQESLVEAADAGLSGNENRKEAALQTLEDDVNSVFDSPRLQNSMSKTVKNFAEEIGDSGEEFKQNFEKAFKDAGIIRQSPAPMWQRIARDFSIHLEEETSKSSEKIANNLNTKLDEVRAAAVVKTNESLNEELDAVKEKSKEVASMTQESDNIVRELKDAVNKLVAAIDSMPQNIAAVKQSHALVFDDGAVVSLGSKLINTEINGEFIATEG